MHTAIYTLYCTKRSLVMSNLLLFDTLQKLQAPSWGPRCAQAGQGKENVPSTEYSTVDIFKQIGGKKEP